MSEDRLEPLVTQCPNCETRFRVTEAQLQVASGRVRCGACLAVFDGTLFLSVDGEVLTVAADNADVDALLDELDVISTREPEEAPSIADFAQEDFAPLPEKKMIEGFGDKETLPDELLALEAELLAEMRAGASMTDADSAAEILDEASLKAPEQLLAAEAAWPEELAEELAEEIWDTAEASPGSDRSGGLSTDTSAEGIGYTGQASDGLNEERGGILQLETAPVATAPTPAAKRPVTAPSHFEQLHLAEDEVPQVKRSWLTYTILLLALFALPAQVLWFQYESWVLKPEYRPIYATLCDYANCELPPMRDASLIVAKRSFIRAHPDREDARIVDVLMVNNAEFAQPYPLIELMATSLRGQLVAGRRFKPAEYLQGEAKPGDLLPPHTPIHVSLEIQDPGKYALNFEVNFR